MIIAGSADQPYDYTGNKNPIHTLDISPDKNNVKKILQQFYRCRILSNR